MNFTKICRTTALALLLLLLLATTTIDLLDTEIRSRDPQDWTHAFCLTQSVLLAACAVYGPGRGIVRLPLVCAWGLALGFALATHNLITLEGRTSFAAGAVLVVAGTLSPLLVFAAHRQRTRARFEFENELTSWTVAGSGYQLSLRMLMILTAAFAVTGVIARSAFAAAPDPFGAEHDILVLHAWLGFFPCLATAPALLVIFRPSWKIALACGFFVVITLADPLLLALATPVVFNDKTLFPNATWSAVRDLGIHSFLWNGQVLIAVVSYTWLARGAGLRMVLPDQSSDKKPNPAAQPETEAGWVQD